MSIRFLIILFFSGLFFSAQAQFSSRNNKFTTDYIQGCAGMDIQVNYPGCGTTLPDQPCAILYGDGRPAESYTTGQIATYPNAGNFMLIVVYSTVIANTDTIDITVTPNNQPAFDVYSCNGNMVSVKVNESNYPYYTINYNDATAEVIRPANSATDVHTYPAPPPNTRNVSVRGYNGPTTSDNCDAKTSVVDVYNVLPATNITQLEVPNSSQVKVDFNTVSSIQYRMMIATNNSTSFQQYKAIYNPPANTETVPSIRPEDNFYCFRMDTYNPCTSSVVASSPVICSVNFDAVAQNNQNLLSWLTAAQSATNNYIDFTMRKEGVDLAPNIAAGQSSYLDTDIICNMDTTYQLVVNYPGNVKSLSIVKPLISFSNTVPTVIEDITASIVDGAAELTWIQDPAFTAKEYSIAKSTGAVAKTTTPSYVDSNYSPESPACYQISYRDACKNVSPVSSDACPVTLTGTLTKDEALKKENIVSLSWTAYSGWQNGVADYTIEKYNASGQLINTFTNVTATSYTDLDAADDFDNQTYTYLVYANPNDGGLPVALSNPITIIKEPNLYYPTAFTPNRDGLNDTFKVFGQYVISFEMKIFNRWGELMYTTDDLDGLGWDGTYKGNLMPEAAYVFRATITDESGRTFDRSGSFLLMHKD